MGNCCTIPPDEAYFPGEESKELVGEEHETSILAITTIRDFQILKVLGRGAFGKVFLVKKNDTQELLAMKVIKKTEIEKRHQYEHTMTERSVLSKLDCPFVVNLNYAFQTETKLYFAMEYMAGGELFYHMHNSQVFTESKARFYISEIILAVEYLHANDIVYRDLKPENILIGMDGHIKLADFGLSKILGPDLMTESFCGTPEYLAPEVIMKQAYNKAVDFWSIGAFLFEIVTGTPPFYSTDKRQIYDKKTKYPVTIPSYLSGNLADLLERLLQRNPKDRLTNFEEVKQHNIKKYRPSFNPFDFLI